MTASMSQRTRRPLRDSRLHVRGPANAGWEDISGWRARAALRDWMQGEHAAQRGQQRRGKPRRNQRKIDRGRESKGHRKRRPQRYRRDRDATLWSLCVHGKEQQREGPPYESAEGEEAGIVPWAGCKDAHALVPAALHAIHGESGTAKTEHGSVCRTSKSGMLTPG